MTAKKFWLPADRVVAGLAPDYACFASDRIMVDGAPVGYMYRDGDGWNFMAGDENQDYVDDPANLGLYSLNVLANYDRAIIDYLDAPPGAAFIRDGAGFVEDPEGAPADPDSDTPVHLNPHFPTRSGYQQLTRNWALTLPQPMNQRMEDGSLVFWRPGLTAWLSAWGDDRDATDAIRRDEFKSKINPRAYNHSEWESGPALCLSYRLAEDHDDARLPALYGFAVAAASHLLLALYVDSGDDLASAQRLLRSVTPL
ncbi:DUF2185 domain-containing protein [Mycobacterium sp. 48b]|uniref:DUF2185 domain-containing protein n=1 Tax=Mycobacterium sp. 48b TaxID=3400426 RepID=UPI003AAFFADA